jgi:multiple sugar transport system permease protein
LADVWKTTPFVAILLLAGLQAIPRDLEESLRLEGSGEWTLLWRLQWPLLAPFVGLAVLFRLAQAVGVFDLIQLLTGGGPAGSTESLALYAYLHAMRFLDFGYSATVMLASFLLMVLLVMLWLGRGRWREARR